MAFNTDVLTDEQHRRVFGTNRVRHMQEKEADREAAAEVAARIAAIREMDRPLTIEEMEKARNKFLRTMIQRSHEMKPQEVIAAVGVLDGEIAARKVSDEPNSESKKPTREEMIRQVQGEKAASQKP